MGRPSKLVVVPSPADASDDADMVEAVDDAGFSIVAPPPDLSGVPGVRTMKCVGVSVKRGRRPIATLVFEEIDTGHVARKWMEIPAPMTRGSKFWRSVVIALGAEPDAGVQLDLHKVFVGKVFKVRVGFRKTPNAGRDGRSKASNALADTKKGPDDFLRVHDLLEVVTP